MNDLLGMVQQCKRDNLRWFPAVAGNIEHYALALCGEAGEVAEIVKKIQRGSVTLEEVHDKLAEEVIDVLIYVCSMISALEVDPVAIYKGKRAKNELRFGPGAVRGSTNSVHNASDEPGGGLPIGSVNGSHCVGCCKCRGCTQGI